MGGHFIDMAQMPSPSGPLRIPGQAGNHAHIKNRPSNLQIIGNPSMTNAVHMPHYIPDYSFLRQNDVNSPTFLPTADWTSQHEALALMPQASWAVNMPTAAFAHDEAAFSPTFGADQTYTFVSASDQQQKRTRRRYEEIERIYICGHNGCDKAYGTLNHLNTHITRQSHGVKRTPEESKRIREEWHARRKQEQMRPTQAEEDWLRFLGQYTQPTVMLS